MSRHRKKTPGAQGVNLGLIITPMLDMSFQILAFFIMTYHPSAMEGHLPGSLVPPDKNIAKKGKSNVDTPDPALSVDEKDLEPGANEAVTVKSRAIVEGEPFSHTEGDNPQPLLLGRLSTIYIREAIEPKANAVAEIHVTGDKGKTRKDILEEHALKTRKAMDILTEELKKLAGREGVSNKTDVKLEADKTLQQEYIMMAYDACKKAGFEKIHFVPPPGLQVKK